jgi:hypothetical protein
MNLKNFFGKINLFNKIKKEKKLIIKNNLLEILFYAIIPGLLINYSLWGIFGIKFHWYSFPSYGIFLYLIKHEVLNIWTHLWFKAPIV